MLELHYFYKDTNDYKVYGSVIFPNPESIKPDDAFNLLTQKLSDNIYFQPEEWSMPSLNPEIWDNKNGDWHQLDRFSIPDTINTHIMESSFLKWVKHIKAFK
ncbi:MAG: hypothetical protein ACEPOV_06630 [Hyphomicrobiales bacterium]